MNYRVSLKDTHHVSSILGCACIILWVPSSQILFYSLPIKQVDFTCWAEIRGHEFVPLVRWICGYWFILRCHVYITHSCFKSGISRTGKTLGNFNVVSKPIKLTMTLGGAVSGRWDVLRVCLERYFAIRCAASLSHIESPIRRPNHI